MANRQTNLSERLNEPRRPLRALIITAAVAAAVIGAAITVPMVSTLTPAPRPAAVVPHGESCPEYRGGVCYTPEMDAAAGDQEAQLEADQAAAVAAAAAAAQAAAEQAAADQAAQQAAAQKTQQHAAAPASGAPGSRVPFIKSDDPNNANGGDYEDPAVYCQNHSASGNPPVCD